MVLKLFERRRLDSYFEEADRWPRAIGKSGDVVRKADEPQNL